MVRLILLLVCLALPAQAERVEVDLELVLAVDISRSMSHTDLAIQRRGYAEALTSAEVLRAITGGPNGRIGLTYVEWSDVRRQRILVDWTLIDGPETAEAIARRIARETGGTLRQTSISSGLDFAARRFESSPFTSWRRIIDISGDGPNNDGPPVVPVRDRIVGNGIVINGLPLVVGTRDPIWSIPDLTGYYRDCVTGGPGSFVLPVVGWDAFADSVRRKLVLEIAGLSAQGEAIVRPAALTDCLIGEKIRERRRPSRE